MPSLSERLKAAAESGDIPERDDVQSAAAVCAAVEAFQAAEQTLQSASLRDDVGPELAAYQAAKARLLEVNLS